MGAPMLSFGFGRADMSLFEPGMTMMGWGRRDNRAEGVAVPLYARAVVIDDGTTTMAFVTLELLVVTQGLWLAVTDTLCDDHPELGLGQDNVFMAATHTHSGPSGFGHHFWINLNAPGFSQVVFDGLVAATVAAIRQAAASRRRGTVRLAKGAVPQSEGIAFNRSWFAYNRNADVRPVSFEHRQDATDREMTVLAFDDAEGTTRGVWQLFGLHGTCVHADNRRLHPDHKGLAALALEADGLGAVLAQECCGDVSPNYRWDARRGHTVGRHDDDLANAAMVADAQVRHTRRLIDEANQPLVGPLQLAVTRMDFSRAPVSATFAPDGREHATRTARLGIAMARGTAEGPGPLHDHAWLSDLLNRVAGAAGRVRNTLRPRARRPVDPQFPLIDLGRGIDGRFLGVFPLASGRMPATDPVLAWTRQRLREGDIGPGPWVPQVLPLALMRLGRFALAIVPFEMTTVAGRRLRATIADSLAASGQPVGHVAIATYANAYTGYCTTFEEYQVQHYEAAYTAFGPFQLAATRTAFDGLARRLAAGGRPETRGPAFQRVDVSSLSRIAFDGPWAE